MVNFVRDRLRTPRRVVRLSDETQRLLDERLPEAVTWCAARVSGGAAARQLRTAALEPELEEELTPAALEASLYELAARRRALLQDAGLTPEHRARVAEQEGRLLLCALESAAGTGEAEAASLGFFDVDDRPPWDSWLCTFVDSHATPHGETLYLLSWVAAPLVESAQAGIAASATQCLSWAE